ncbi:MAG: DUF1732 domain-containing protein [Holophagales bacterium]|nr:DUF1732 domain-containing protein [Holophagales bacterium]
MKSMTGFAETVWPLENGQARLSLRSVNHRALEMTFRLHPVLFPLESEIRSSIRERALRGKLDLTIDVQGAPGAEPVINRGLLRNVALAWKEETEHLGLPPLSAEAFFKIPGAFSAAPSAMAKSLEKPIMEALHSLLDEWNGARADEAARLKPFFDDAIAQLIALHGQLSLEAGANSAELPEVYQKRIESILDEAGLHGKVPEERLVAEVGLLAEKQDVREELVRLHAHLDDMRQRLVQGRVTGKALDVWHQEVLREVNTIGSKCRRLAMTRAVMEAKGILEQMREQGANLE